MVGRLIISTALAAALSVPAWAAGKPHDVSWGKPDVSFARYNQDAQQCANRAFGIKAGMLPETAEALGAIQAMNLYSFFTEWEARDHGGRANAAAAVRPDRVPFRNTTYTGMYTHAAYVDVVTQLQAAVDQCLVERGYHRFRLTNAQLDQLRRLRLGTAEREHYLHSLGSNASVLAAQEI